MSANQNGTQVGPKRIGRRDYEAAALGNGSGSRIGKQPIRTRSGKPDTPSPGHTPASSTGRRDADQILDLVDELRSEGSLQLFHDPSGNPYAQISSPAIAGTRTLEVTSKEFERHLLGVAFGRQQKAGHRARAVPQASWTDASRTMAAWAVHDGPLRAVYTRVARLENPTRVVIDLGDEGGSAIVVTGAEWSVMSSAPVAFRRSPTMRALPNPEPGCSADLLRHYVHVSDASYPLVLAWAVNALAATVPNALIDLHGEQGSAKSTSARCLRRLIDPAQPDLRGLPRDERDLVIAAHNNYVLGFDNLSGLDSRLSDAFCRLSDGSGFGTRRLHTDREEEVFSGARPILLTGIEPATTAADLLDRTYLVEAPRIVNHRGERELFAEFERDRPQLFGLLLDGVVSALAGLESVELAEVPRREDAARFAVAAEPGLGLPQGSIATALRSTHEQAVTFVTESSPFIQGVIDLVEECHLFTGTMKQLLHELDTRRVDTRARGAWPSGPVAAGHALRRGASTLRAMGMEVEHLGPSGRKRDRLWRIAEPASEPNRDHAG